MGWIRLPTRRGAILIVGIWAALAGALNLAVPQLETVVHEHTRAFMPADARSSLAAVRSAELFGEPADNNLTYLVLERPGGRLGAADRAYHDRLVTALHADNRHVRTVTELWSDPLTEPFAVSADGHAVTVMLRLVGQLGTTEAADAVRSVRVAAQATAVPVGLDVFLTGPGATIADEFSAIDRQMLLITAMTVGLILALLLLVYRSVVAALIPLLSVGLALAVARPIAAALGDAGVIEVSLFSVALLAP